MKTFTYFYDENKIQYSLVKSHSEKTANWLFMPGGPGANSRYLLDLLKNLDLPGNLWLFDLPSNGGNQTNENIDYESWGDIFIDMIKKFENPILVGHSFGGMYPLLFPILEDLLKGFVILNSTPLLWLPEDKKCANRHYLPTIAEIIREFIRNPNTQTFLAALSAYAPYYFPQDNLEYGKKLWEEMALYIQYKTSAWWLQKVLDTNITNTWIPDKVPTVILGGTHDFICPFSLYENDLRYKRSNIEMFKIENASHFPWIEEPLKVAQVFKDFSERVLLKDPA